MLKRSVTFSVFFFILAPLWVMAQHPDSLQVKKDSSFVSDSIVVKDSLMLTDSAIAVKKGSSSPALTVKDIFEKNFLLNISAKPAEFIQRERKPASADALFYALALVTLLFAILKFIYPRYFGNLFRVFFNTSLRQTQLTDQLLQAKLPSMFFNLFFAIIGGWYIFLLFKCFGLLHKQSEWKILLLASAGIIIIYSFKYLILKFTGWITGYRQEADTYIFIVFLINKVLAICLLPLLIIIAFSSPSLVKTALVLSYMVIGLMVLMRFIRSYGLLQNRIKVSGFHFFIYIIGIEIVPLMVIYKAVLFFVTKNL